MSAAFLLASLVLAVTPGPGVAYIVSRTLAQGRAAGLASALGVALGNMANAVGASIGLAALFAASALAFTVVKFAGAAYLIWLGVRMLRGASSAAAPDAPALALPVARAQLFRDGALVAFLNPKTALFFAAFLPQFMQAGAPAWPQAMWLGAVFVGIAALTDIGYVMLASMAAKRCAQARLNAAKNAAINDAPHAATNDATNAATHAATHTAPDAATRAKWGRRASGAVLIGLGLLTAASPAAASGGPLAAAKPC